MSGVLSGLAMDMAVTVAMLEATARSTPRDRESELAKAADMEDMVDTAVDMAPPTDRAD